MRPNIWQSYSKIQKCHFVAVHQQRPTILSTIRLTSDNHSTSSFKCQKKKETFHQWVLLLWVIKKVSTAWLKSFNSLLKLLLEKSQSNTKYCWEQSWWAQRDETDKSLTRKKSKSGKEQRREKKTPQRDREKDGSVILNRLCWIYSLSIRLPSVPPFLSQTLS